MRHEIHLFLIRFVLLFYSIISCLSISYREPIQLKKKYFILLKLSWTILFCSLLICHLPFAFVCCFFFLFFLNLLS
ncbi:hypothetical protein J3Q64DRAFT_1722827 [Phycomyces blakesleeanus]|uniref:Uncharacterized protein n=1 Tax=Phycomyces blakesleeanus TaxID=4837 RepID=A0ABR3BBG8_PHYBL